MIKLPLGLDEALVTVNGSEIFSVEPNLDVFYQINECFGCQYQKLRSLNTSVQDFTISTKRQLSLELRSGSTGETLCQFEGLNLNDHGHYMFQMELNEEPVAGTPNSSVGSSATFVQCTVETLDRGSCMLCPFVLLLALILLTTLFENVFKKLSGTLGANLLHRSAFSDQNARQLKRSGSPEQPVTVENLHPQPYRVSQTEPEVAGDSQANDRAKGAKRARIDSLDAFRGLTIGAMIMANYGGAGYGALEHSAWDGLTVADLVFPCFIFLMGASIAISTRSMLKRELNISRMFAKIARRAALLALLGICLNSKWLEGRSLGQLRLPGVLQRFAVSYLVVGVMYAVEVTINKWFKAHSLYRLPLLARLLVASFELSTAANFLFLYAYFTFYFHYSPFCPAGYLGPGGATEGAKFANCTGGAAAWLDRLLLGPDHLYTDRELLGLFRTEVSHDPEGILGNTTSILLTLVGLQCGKILIKRQSHGKRLYAFFIWISGLAISCVNVVIIPINKKLWSLTFVTVSALCAFVLMALLYLIVDVNKCQKIFLLRLLISAGKNSMFLYVAHSLLHGMLPWHFAVDESSHLQLLLRLAWATFLWLLAAHFMASRKLFLRL